MGTLKPLHLIFVIVLTHLCGCTFSPVIPSLDEVNFTKTDGEWTGWAVYEIGRDFKNMDLELMFRSAKAGLQYADMDIISMNTDEFWVAGKRGATFEYYSIPSPAGEVVRVSNV